MRAISVREPFASDIASGKKRIENRSWGATITGDVALHRCGRGGAIIGIMHVACVIPWQQALAEYPEQNEYISGPLCWIVDRFTPCAPLPCSGKLSLWECPELQVAPSPSWSAAPTPPA